MNGIWLQDDALTFGLTSHVIIYHVFASVVFTLILVLTLAAVELLHANLLNDLSHSFRCSFRAWSWNVSCNCSLSAIRTHRASRILVICCKIMIEFCMRFQHTLASLVLFPSITTTIFLSFNQMHILAWILLCLTLVIKTIIDIAIVQSLSVHASLSAIRITDEHSDFLRCYVVITHVGHSERNVAIVISLGIRAQSIGDELGLVDNDVLVLF